MDIPKHVAIIMDGNGRWAQRRRHPRVFGHVRGSARVRDIVKAADQLGIRALTLYAFSTENWSRPSTELRVLWKILRKYLVSEVNELHRNGVRLRTIGEIDRLEPEVRAILEETKLKLSQNTGLQLTLALSYGSRRELVLAAQKFAQDCVDGKAVPRDMDEDLMRHYLWTSELGELSDIDLVIRTSGEKRISNFLLWQAAYAEYIFYDLCWPDFQPQHLQEAVAEYSGRERRFGGLKKIQPRPKDGLEEAGWRGPS